MSETIYIHYGSDHFDPVCFTPIRNCDWKPKPADGTGLWASQEGKKIFHGDEYAGSVYEDGRVVYGWKEWCEDSQFHTEDLKKYFRFQLSEEAKVILLKDPSDLLPLPKTKTWKPKDNSEILSPPEGTDADSIFLERAIEREKDHALKEALRDLDEFLFGW